MKALRILLLLVSVTLVANLQAEGVNNNNYSADTENSGVESVQSPTMAPEEFPKFVGGDVALFRFIEENLNYPESAVENEIEGRVTIRFVVTEIGQIRSARIVKGIGCVQCDQEALRLVYSMPNWIPAKTKGYNVASCYAIPVTFRAKKDVKNQK